MYHDSARLLVALGFIFQIVVIRDDLLSTLVAATFIQKVLRTVFGSEIIATFEVQFQ